MLFWADIVRWISAAELVHIVERTLPRITAEESTTLLLLEIWRHTVLTCSHGWGEWGCFTIWSDMGIFITSDDLTILGVSILPILVHFPVVIKLFLTLKDVKWEDLLNFVLKSELCMRVVQIPLVEWIQNNTQIQLIPLISWLCEELSEVVLYHIFSLCLWKDQLELEIGLITLGIKDPSQ